MDQDQSATKIEQIEHKSISAKERTPETTKNDNSRETPPPPKKKYEIMKDPAFLSSPIYPPILLSKPPLSTNRDNQLIPIFSHDRFIFESQLTSLYMHPTGYAFKLNNKNEDFSNLSLRI